MRAQSEGFVKCPDTSAYTGSETQALETLVVLVAAIVMPGCVPFRDQDAVLYTACGNEHA